MRRSNVRWTNKSVLRMAGKDDPVHAIEQRARKAALAAMDAGWTGPPYNPVAIAKLMRIPVEPNASVADARTVPHDDWVKIEFNPGQTRERLRFSLAHEVAHALFPDVSEKVRHRGSRASGDEWQLETLCNIAAAEFVLPIGSMASRDNVAPIEQLMRERREFDVSAEAYLIRVAETTREPILMFCASLVEDREPRRYRIDYQIPSSEWGGHIRLPLAVPDTSLIKKCTGIGQTLHGTEQWSGVGELYLEIVGIPGYPGSRLPRIAGIVRAADHSTVGAQLHELQGDVLTPIGEGPKFVCQLVNDQARSWGGGVAKKTARKYPEAEKSFKAWIDSIPRSQRLGRVHYADAAQGVTIASLVAQHGFGAGPTSRIRYAALYGCLSDLQRKAVGREASIHMPRIGTGASGGSWQTVEQMVRELLLSAGLQVTIYDLPPARGDYSLEAPRLI